MRGENVSSSLLDVQYDGLIDAVDRVNLARRFSGVAGVVFLLTPTK